MISDKNYFFKKIYFLFFGLFFILFHGCLGYASHIRIISLAPNITELLFAAGAGKYVVGVMSGSDYPSEVKKIPVVGTFNQLNEEAILILRPNFIFAEKTQALFYLLNHLKIPIVYIQINHLLDIPKALRHLGEIVGIEKQANDAAVKFEKKYFFLKKQYKTTQKISVFYEIWPQPLLTITKNNWINDAIELCGGENIFENLMGSAPAVSLEAVILKQPRVILSSMPSSDWTNFWRIESSIPAVKNQAFFTIFADYIERAGPRVLQGVEQICQALVKARRF